MITGELVGSKRDELGWRITLPAEREAVGRAYVASGLTKRAFARREGIKYSTLVSWVKRQRWAWMGPPRPAFAEFTIMGPGGLEVLLPDGVVMCGGRVKDLAKLLRLVRC